MDSFDQLKLSKDVSKAIHDLGFTTPSPIQASTLPILLGKDTDFIGQAATGTGKTAAFGIPLVERIDTSKRAVQGLILCPTRELAVQVAGQIDLIGKYKGVETVAIYGGAAYDPQIRGLKQGRAVVVGTPGRILDHLKRGTLKLGSVKTIILDEADEMISMGFKEDLETILEEITSEDANTWLFSATMSPPVRQVAEKYLEDPEQVSINRGEMLSSSVEQIYYLTHESNKPEILCKIIDSSEEFYGLVFCQTKLLVTDLTKFLQSRGFKVDCLHGDMSQAARESTMADFRDRTVQILICTDVASRGLDVKDVTHVVNYSLPRETDVYVHRIGRTARGGKAGTAISLVTPSHRALIRRIENVTRGRMVEGRIPGRREIARKKVTNLLPAFKGQKWQSRAIESMDEDWKEAIAGMSEEEIAGRFICMIFGELFTEREKDADDGRLIRDPKSRDGERARDRGERSERNDRGPRRGHGRSDRGDRNDRGYEGRGKRFGGRNDGHHKDKRGSKPPHKRRG